MQLRKGKLVVLEGLDATGKSTQMERLRSVFGNDTFIHSPSGNSEVSRGIYALTERERTLTPLGRQLLHLSAAAEMYERDIVPALTRGGVFMDRCWWSTFAYGYFGRLEFLIDMPDYLKLCKLPSQGVMPDAVFVFMHAWKRDEHNDANVIKGYEYLTLDLYPEIMEPMEIGDEQAQMDQITFALAERDLLEPGV